MRKYIKQLEEQNEELKKLLAEAQEKLAKSHCIVSGLVVSQINRSFEHGIMKTEITLIGSQETEFIGDIKCLIGNQVTISTRGK